jgi:serine/threonine protein kinase
MLDMFIPIIKTLGQMHKVGIIHRDIAPDNIMVRTDGSAKLIDFGAAIENESGDNKATVALVKHGYGPEELYDNNHARQGTWSDVYSICATMYRTLTGRTPPDAVDRLRGMVLPGIETAVSEKTKKAIFHGMALRAPDRIQTMEQLLSELGFAEQAPVIPQPAPEPTPPTAYIFCGYCGNKLPANAKFCNKCGKVTITDENIVPEHSVPLAAPVIKVSPETPIAPAVPAAEATTKLFGKNITKITRNSLIAASLVLIVGVSVIVGINIADDDSVYVSGGNSSDRSSSDDDDDDDDSPRTTTTAAPKLQVGDMDYYAQYIYQIGTVFAQDVNSAGMTFKSDSFIGDNFINPVSLTNTNQ